MTHEINRGTLLIIGRILVPCFMVAIMSANSEADQIYNFVADGTGDILAVLELTSLPATHSEVAELLFTTEGEALFGYSSPYTGGFDSTTAMFTDDGMNGLEGGTIWDFSPLDSILHPSSGTDFLQLSASNIAGHDVILVSPEVIGPDPEIIASGNWRAVPEPTSFALISAVLFGVAVRRQRNSDRPN